MAHTIPQSTTATIEERFVGMFNAVTALILGSPFHRLRSGNTILLGFSGRKSGKQYRTPVSYTRSGEELRVFTATENTWWKNLQGGATVQVLLRGRWVRGRALVYANEPARFTEHLADHVRRVPRDVKFHNIHWDAPGQPNHADVVQAAERVVMICIALEDIGTRN